MGLNLLASVDNHSLLRFSRLRTDVVRLECDQNERQTETVLRDIAVNRTVCTSPSSPDVVATAQSHGLSFILNLRKSENFSYDTIST